MFRVGIGKEDITGPVAGLNLMGFVHAPQIGSGLNDRLYCRAFYISASESDSNEHLLLVHTDLMSISLRLRQRIISKLEEQYGNFINSRSVVIHSQHTHSTPGGLHPDLVYYFASLGFSLNHFNFITDRILSCIDQALDSSNIFTSKIYFSSLKLPNVGRNRSPEAFKENLDSLKKEFLKLNKNNKREVMSILRIVKWPENVTKSVLTFFPIHTTSFYKENHMISGDNKGFAQYLIETKYNITAAFFQTEAGDVSPNMADDPKNDIFKHLHADYIESCEISGKQQAEGVEKVLRGEIKETELDPELGSRLSYFNFGEHCPGVSGISTLAGTEDGRGTLCVNEGMNETTVEPSLSFKYLKDWFCVAQARYLIKLLITNPAMGRGQSYEYVTHKKALRSRTQRWKDFIVDSFLDFDANIFKVENEGNLTCQQPKILAGNEKSFKESFVPNILPLQILRLGNLILPTLPFEVTSMAGHLIRKSLQNEFRATGTGDEVYVEILAISNGYSQYLTTEPEFKAQHYEGASTLFGKNQLHLIISEYEKLAQAMNTNSEYGKSSEKNEFLKKIKEIPENEQEFDDSQTSLIFDEVMHSINSKLDIMAKPGFRPFESSKLGDVKSDVHLTTLDLLSKDEQHRQKMKASFHCVFPGNSQRVVKSFCNVLKGKTGNEIFLTDSDWNVRFVFKNEYFIHDICTCEWLVHNSKEHFDIADDFYRLQFNGAFVDEDVGEKLATNDEIKFFSGTSSPFKIINGGHEISFDDITRLSGNLVTDDYQIYIRNEVLVVITLVTILALRCLVKCCWKSKNADFA